MDLKFSKVTRKGPITIVTLSRPEVYNALHIDAHFELNKVFDEFSADPEQWVAIVTGAGEKAFCAGNDLKWQAAGGKRGWDKGGFAGLTSRFDCDKPIIAAVNGTAAGMGAHLAFACDLVIAAEGTKFIEVFSRRGLVVDALGAYLLPRTIGLHKAKELVLFADDLPVAEAERLGLVNKVVPRDELAATAGEWAGRLASGPTKALGLSKWLLNQSFDVDRATMMSNEAIAVELNTHSEDFAEGMSSFRERRDPVWRGY